MRDARNVFVWQCLGYLFLWLCGTPPAIVASAAPAAAQGSSRQVVKTIAPVICPQDQRTADWSLRTPWSAIYAFTEGTVCRALHASDFDSLRNPGIQFGLPTGLQARVDVKKKLRVWAILIDDQGTADQMAANALQILGQRPALIEQHRQARRDIHALETELDQARAADAAATQAAVQAQDALEAQYETNQTYDLIVSSRRALLEADVQRKDALSTLTSPLKETIYALEAADDAILAQIENLDAQVTGLLGQPATCTVAEVGSVQFLSMEAPLDAHPGIGGGERVFPDAPSAGAGPRRQVKVRVTANPPIPGLQIHVRAFDRDDPSTDRAILDGTGTDGDDNLGEIATLDGSEGRLVKTTGAGGIVDLVLIVGLQPGDNYDVASDCPHGVVDALSSAAVSRNEASFRISAGPLTVWRRLHVERDAMPAAQQADPAPPGGKLKYYAPAGVMTTVKKDKGGKQATVTFTPDLDSQEVLLDSENRFTNGLLRDEGSRLTYVIRTSRTVGADVVLEVDGILQKPEHGKPIKEIPDQGQRATLFDDDFAGTAERSLPGVPAPLDVARDVFRIACIDVLDEVPGVANPDAVALPVVVSWESRGDRDAFLRAHAQSDASRENHFWIAYVADGFQGLFDTDFDPNTETDDTQGGVTGRLPDNGPLFASFLWRETHRDVAAALQWNAGQSALKRSKTAAHEIAHQFGVDPNHQTGGLMGAKNTGGASNDVVNPSPLLAVHLRQIREHAESPGRRTKESP